MRVLITGGTGLIGRALAAHLAAEGRDVIILSRSPARATGLPAGVQAAAWDARTADGWAHLAEGAGAIVNLAGASLAGEGAFPSRWTPRRKALIRQSRLEAGQAVVEAVKSARHKPNCVIQSSGIGIYGSQGDNELTESAETSGEGFLPGLAIEWEASTERVEDEGVRRAVIRSGVVLSLAGGSLPLTLLPFRFFLGGPLGSGRQWWSWIHVQDEVRAISFLIDRPDARGAFNLCAPEPLPNAEFARAIGRVMGRPALVPVPTLALRLLLGEVSTVLLDSLRGLPERLLDAGFGFQYPTLDGALRHLLHGEGRG